MSGPERRFILLTSHVHGGNLDGAVRVLSEATTPEEVDSLKAFLIKGLERYPKDDVRLPKALERISQL